MLIFVTIYMHGINDKHVHGKNYFSEASTIHARALSSLLYYIPFYVYILLIKWPVFARLRKSIFSFETFFFRTKTNVRCGGGRYKVYLRRGAGAVGYDMMVHMDRQKFVIYRKTDCARENYSTMKENKIVLLYYWNRNVNLNIHF